MRNYFITLSALKRGIIRIEADKASQKGVNLYVNGEDFAPYRKGEWHKTLREAREQCEIMRKKAIVNKKFELARLKKLEFK